MKFTRILLLPILLVCSCILYSCNKNGVIKQRSEIKAKLLPALIEAEDHSTKIEIMYDNQNRITLFKTTHKSPSDTSSLDIVSQQITYKGDSLILEYKTENKRGKSNTKISSRISRIYYANNTVNILGDSELYSEYYILNNKGQLIEMKVVSDDMGAGQKFEYDERGRMKRVTDFYLEVDISKSIECIYPEEARLNALSNINSPDWLLTYLFNITSGYYNSVQSWRTNSSSLGVDFSYLYNDDGYPVSVTSKIVGAENQSVTVTLNITYIEAK